MEGGVRVYERCQKHDLACGPDGQCVICRREASRPRFSTSPADEQTGAGRFLTALMGSGLLLYLAAMAWILVYPESFPIDPSSYWPRRDRAAEAQDGISFGSEPPGVPGSAAPGGETPSSSDKQPGREEIGGSGLVELAPGPRPEGSPDPSDRGDLGLQPGLGRPDRRLEMQGDRETAERDRRRKEMILIDRQERIRAAARRNVQVTMYAASWCPSCTRARRYLMEKGIGFTERDIENDPAARQRLTRLNPRSSVPTFEIDGQVRVGFRPSGLQAAIEAAARERMKQF